MAKKNWFLVLATMLMFGSCEPAHAALSEADKTLLTNKNYAINGGAENGTAGAFSYADAAGTSPVDGIGGSPTITLTRTTSSPLDGNASFLITKDAANRQGQGASFNFKVPASAQAKMVGISFAYQIASGTYDAGSDTTDPDLTAWVYGPTDGTPTLTQIAPYKVVGCASGIVCRFQANVQTSVTGSTYRLILHEAKTGTSAYTFKLDNIVVSTSPNVYGAPVTDWQSYTPTGNFTSNTTYKGQWRRIGDSMEIDINETFSGGTNTNVFAVNIPTGYTIDVSKVAIGTASPKFNVTGNCKYFSNSFGGDGYSPGSAAVESTTQISCIVLSNGTTNGGTTISNTQPVTIDSTAVINVHAMVPIVGWASTLQLSQDNDARLVSFSASNGAVSGGTVTNPGTLVKLSTITIDSHGAYSSSTGNYTVPAPGDYLVLATVDVGSSTFSATNSSQAQIFKNGSIVEFGNVNGITGNSDANPTVFTIQRCKAGDTLSLFALFTGSNGVIGSASNTRMYITRLPGSAQIAANEAVNARYYAGGSQSTTGAAITIVFNTKVFDTHAAMNASTGVYTFPAPGKYRIYVSQYGAGPSFTPGQETDIQMQKNGSNEAVCVWTAPSSVSAGVAITNQCETTMQAVAGDLFRMQYSHNGSGTYNLNTTPNYNYVTIERIN